MTKLTDTIRAALAKKKGVHHPENNNIGAAEIKATKVKNTPPAGKKTPIRNAGRGR
jgi:hypothetical protein